MRATSVSAVASAGESAPFLPRYSMSADAQSAVQYAPQLQAQVRRYSRRYRRWKPTRTSERTSAPAAWASWLTRMTRLLLSIIPGPILNEAGSFRVAVLRRDPLRVKELG